MSATWCVCIVQTGFKNKYRDRVGRQLKVALPCFRNLIVWCLLNHCNLLLDGICWVSGGKA